MEIFKHIDSIDGIYGGYCPNFKNWVSAAIGAAVGIGSTLFGASKSAEAEREARRKEDAQHAKNQAYYNRRYNEDYADTAAGQNMLRRAKEYADSNWKKAQGASAVGGGTDASVAMAKEAGNKVVSDTMANISANDTARKDNVDRMRNAEENAYASQQAQHDRQRGANIANVASAMGNAAMSVGSSLENPSGGAGKVTEATQDAIKQDTTSKIINNVTSQSRSLAGSNLDALKKKQTIGRIYK